MCKTFVENIADGVGLAFYFDFDYCFYFELTC